jgi:phage shock protein C
MRVMRERLYRSRRERVIGGLAGGLARNLGIDVTWVRLGWVLLAFATQGAAILVYLVLLFVIPEEPEEVADAEATAAAGTELERSADLRSSSEPPAAERGAQRPAGRSGPASALDRFAEPTRTGEGSRTAALVVGIVLVAAGGWILLRRYIVIDFDLGWPVIAIVLGVILVLASFRPRGRRA